MGETPLHRAVTRLKGDKLTSELLLKNGADPNLQTTAGMSPLHLVLLTSVLKKRGENAAVHLVGMN